jgi:hypothetical protein
VRAAMVVEVDSQAPVVVHGGNVVTMPRR